MREAAIGLVMSVLPHGATRLSLDGFSWIFLFQDFSKMLRACLVRIFFLLLVRPSVCVVLFLIRRRLCLGREAELGPLGCTVSWLVPALFGRISDFLYPEFRRTTLWSTTIPTTISSSSCFWVRVYVVTSENRHTYVAHQNCGPEGYVIEFIRGACRNCDYCP